jgi:hypothetical protein
VDEPGVFQFVGIDVVDAVICCVGAGGNHTNGNLTTGVIEFFLVQWVSPKVN